MGLSLKKILITGGSKRIGAALATHLAADGWHVIIHCNKNRKSAEALCKRLIEKGREVEVLQADAILILTEWEDYKTLNWKLIYNLMRKPAWIFDTRSIVSSKEVIEAGLKLWELGRGYSS